MKADIEILHNREADTFIIINKVLKNRINIQSSAALKLGRLLSGKDTTYPNCAGITSFNNITELNKYAKEALHKDKEE